MVKKPKRVHILGGGLAGMMTAYGLLKRGFPVVIYEASARLGGKAGSEGRPSLLGADFKPECELAADAWAMHLDPDEIVVGPRLRNRGRGFTHAEADLQNVPLGVGQQLPAVVRHVRLAQEEVTQTREDDL